jgi:hypothetical protein
MGDRAEGKAAAAGKSAGRGLQGFVGFVKFVEFVEFVRFDVRRSQVPWNLRNLTNPRT